MRDLSLRFRIAVSMAVVLFAVAALLVWWLPARMHAVAREWSELRAIGLSSAVAQTSVAALDFGAAEFADQRLLLMSEFPDARYAVLLGEDGSRIGAWGAPPEGLTVGAPPPAPAATRDGELLVVRVPLASARSGQRGLLIAGFDQTGLDRWRAENTAFIATSLMIVWLIGLGVSWALGTVLVRPLAEVTESARRLGGLELAAAGGYRRDEARVLAETFERMEARLRAQMTELDAERQRAVAAEAAAVEASIAKSRFLANMSHELRTPLNAILGYCDLLLDMLEEMTPDEVRRDLTNVGQSGRHLLALINDILDLAKIESGRLELSLEAVDVVALIRGLVAETEPVVRRNGNRLDVVVPDAGPEATLDPLRLRQCVLNLVSNAAKFTRDGQVGVRAWFEGDGVTIEVSDTGIGIAPEDLGRLFQPFVQVDASTTRRFGGTGLGLSITRLLAQRMGGDLSVRSALGVGSTFVLRFPGATAGRS